MNDSHNCLSNVTLLENDIYYQVIFYISKHHASSMGTTSHNDICIKAGELIAIAVGGLK